MVIFILNANWRVCQGTVVINEAEPVICQLFSCRPAWYCCWHCIQYSHSMLRELLFPFDKYCMSWK